MIGFKALPSSDDKTTYPFKCRLCSNTYESPWAAFTNLNSHLRFHTFSIDPKYEKYKIWHEDRTEDEREFLTENVLLLTKHFITTNSNFTEFQSESMIELLSQIKGLEMPHYKTFRFEILPTVYEIMRGCIETELEKAESICLISDLWSSKAMKSFIAISAVIVDSLFEKKILVIDLVCLKASIHTAETLKIQTEENN